MSERPVANISPKYIQDNLAQQLNLEKYHIFLKMVCFYFIKVKFECYVGGGVFITDYGAFVVACQKVALVDPVPVKVFS